MTILILRKVWGDLAHNKARTLLAVLSIAAGVFAVGLAFGALGVMRAYIEQDKLATKPADLTFRAGALDQDAFHQDLIDAALRRPGVADAEGETTVPLRWKLEREKNWRNGVLVARTDYDAQRIALIELLEGLWPARHTLAVERKSSQYFAVPLGATILVESGQGERGLPVVGVVRKPYVLQPQFGGDATFYATPETVTWLTGLDGFDKLRVRLDAPNTTGDQVRDWLERIGLADSGIGATGAVDEIGVQQMRDALEANFLILIVMGGLSLGVSAFLIVNTMNALVVQQVWQIGIMKALGMTFGQVVCLYLATALTYGGLALLLAVPPAAVGAFLMVGWVLDMGTNITTANTFQVSPAVVALQVVVGLAVPLLAALPPVIGGARVSPRQAISSRGLGGSSEHGVLNQFVERVRGLPLLLALSLRNTFRRRGRTALALMALTFVGTLFMMVKSVQGSFDNSAEALLRSFRYDVMIVFSRPCRTTQLVEMTESLPGVTRVEVWDRREVRLALAGGSKLQVGIYGVPPDSEMFNPQVVNGRGLLPEDSNAILLNKNLAADQQIQVGDVITLTIAGKETSWAVVGLILNAAVGQNDTFVPLDTLARTTGNHNQGSLVMLTSERHDTQAQEKLIEMLRDIYTARGIQTMTFQSASSFRETSRTFFSAIALLLLTMVMLAAVVGGIGLMGALSINVVERRREIGVMRALGTTASGIVEVFVGEGVLVGLLSWLFAVPLSYPAARAFSDAVGLAAFGTPLNFSYSVTGVILWLAMVLALSALASLWPALAAARVSVREALAYE